MEIAPSSGLKRRDIEITNYLSDSACSRNLVIDVGITHDRNGSSSANPHLNGTLSHPYTPDSPLNEAAKQKVNDTNENRNSYANNHSISFLPAITSTSACMHGELIRLLFLQAHRETEDYLAFMGTPVHSDQDQFHFRRVAFYSSLKSKVGLIAAKAAALRINMNTDSCLIASRAASRRLASSHATSLLNSSLSNHLPRPLPFPHPN
jgi:hypothetical protein